MYATVAEANEYVSSYYTSTDTLREQWEDLEDEDKQVLLNRAERFIDFLPYKGKAMSKDKAFPRKPNPERSLQQAKLATIELSIRGLDTEASSRYQMREQGVTSFKIGDLSETYGEVGSMLGASGIDPYSFSIIFPFLSEWLQGGYNICPTHFRR